MMFFIKILMPMFIIASAEAGSVSSTMAIPEGTYVCRAFQNDEIVFEQGLVILDNIAIDIKTHHKYKAQSRFNNKGEVYYVIDEPLVGIMIFKNDSHRDKQGNRYYGSGFRTFPNEKAQTYNAEYRGACYLLKN